MENTEDILLSLGLNLKLYQVTLFFSSLGTFFPSLGAFFPSLGTFFPFPWDLFPLPLGPFSFPWDLFPFPCDLVSFSWDLFSFPWDLGPTTVVLLLRVWPQELFFFSLGFGSQQQEFCYSGSGHKSCFFSIGIWVPTTGVLLLRVWPQGLFLPLGTGSQQQ